MKTVRIILLIAIAGIVQYINGQEVTQIIRGKISDSESQTPLPFATISITTVNPQIGTTSDSEGNFRLENVPVGRHNIQILYMGYETMLVPELMVTSGKEIVLNISLKEKISKVDEVVVKAFAKKDKPLNNMSTLSARTFSVEEAQRYAGGFDDPARLASSFAGVTTGYLDDNGIIVRGNTPKGLLWRLEGVEIPNPNHFADMSTFGGGGVSALSSLMLANSDFFTGAFPSEYGNAMSGVFDINLRAGNNEKHEHAVQFGALGLDISSEGPFSKKQKASYLFNYRYSTFGMIKPILPEEANIPVYQDLCFKLNLPTNHAGTFSVWGLATDDKINFLAETDTSKWNYLGDREDGNATQRLGAVGINHRLILKQKSYINSNIAVTGNQSFYQLGLLDAELDKIDKEYAKISNYKYTVSSTINSKLSAKHSNRTGFIFNNIHYSTLLKYAPEEGQALVTTADDDGSSNLIQVFTQLRYNFTYNIKLNLGVHSQYFDVNKELVIEPRAGITFSLNEIQSVSIAYGKHSRLEPQSIYLTRVSEGNEIIQPNKDLKVSKAHHIVASYDISLNQNLRLKIEPYAQFLYDIPVIPDSSYSTINMEADWFFSQKLNNTGTATNYGLDITLERFLNNGFYYLITASLFDSKYVGGDNIERSSRYNSNYVFNVLFGKEWVLGSAKNKILGINGRLNVMGGQRTTPVNQQESLVLKDVIFDYSRLFEEQKPTIYHLNASVVYRINKKNHASIWTLQVLNGLGMKEFYGYSYNYRTNKLDKDEVLVVVPSLSYKIEF